MPLLGFAQEPPTPDSGTPRPPVPEPVPNLENEAAEGDSVIRGREVDPNKVVVEEGDFITEANITVLEAAKIYEKASGRRAILTNDMAQAEVSFTLGGPLTNAELAKFLQLTLLQEGVAIIPVPGEPGIVRFVPSGPINSVQPTPKDVYFDEYNLPAKDEVVMFVMEFKYLKPEEALKILQAAMGQLTAAGTIAAVPNASALIITENASLIRQMLKIRKAIDVPTPVGQKWVKVTYGDVEVIGERMNEIYNDQGSSQQTTRTTRANAPPTPPTPGAAAGSSTSGEEIPLKIIPALRTSRILLVGRPADLIAAEAMIESFDQPSDGSTRQTFRLRYLRVSEFLQIAENAITVTLGDAAAGGAGAGGGRQNQALNNNRNNRTNNNRGNNNNLTTGQQGGGAGGGSGLGGSAGIEVQQIPTAPESVQVGRTLLVADNVANTVIVSGPPHHIEIVRNLISDLDTEAQQVALSAVVGSYGLGDDLNFGLDLAKALQRTGSDFAAAGLSSFGGVPSIIDPSTLDTLGAVLSANGAAGNGVSVYGQIGDDFGIFVNALENQTEFKTLERTVLTTRNNRVATLTSGQRIAIPSSTFTGGLNQGGQTTNVEYRDVVLELEIQPLINSDNQVTLEISLVRDSIGQPRTVGELVIPDINTETLTTSVMVQNASAVILGGIMTTTSSDAQGGVPFISRIPGIGRLFGRTEQSNTESELIIMIQPRIMQGQAEVDRFRADYSRQTRYTRDAEQLLPTPSGMLPSNGTMPAARQDPKGGVLSVSEEKEEKPRRRTSAGRKKGYLR